MQRTVAMAKLPCSIWKIRKLCYGLPQFRTFLSAAYRCEEAWSNRLNNPILSSIDPGRFVYDLDRKFKYEGNVSAIDVDLFVNRLLPTDAKNMNEDLEDLVKRLRRSPQTKDTLPSTSHAVLRILLDTRRTKLMLKLLSNPLEFGIFADHYVSNLLMDTFIEEKNYTGAARVASMSMLQEDYGPPLTQALAIASCYLYATSSENLPWEDYTVKPEEPAEEVKIRIKYLRNHYFDDHFDLRDPNHIVGKTLAWGAPLIGGEIGINCEILGWALYNKWSDLESTLHRCVENSIPVAASVVTSVKEIVNSRDEAEVEKILTLVNQLESKDINLRSLIENHVKTKVEEAETNDIKNQEEVYSTWDTLRKEEVDRQIEIYRRKQLMAEIEKKMKELEEREELFNFFDNQDKLEMIIDWKPTPRERDQIFFFPPKFRKGRTVDKDYIPADVKSRSN